jgi:hypothetical protein
MSWQPGDARHEDDTGHQEQPGVADPLKQGPLAAPQVPHFCHSVAFAFSALQRG